MSEKTLLTLDKWVQQYMIKECLCKSIQEITELGSNGQNQHAKWTKVKEDIKEHAIKITEEERKKANKMIKECPPKFQQQKTEREPERNSCSSKAP